MSDPKRISPLLDGFTMGNPISEHDGVRCCPAIKENSDTKYIVKILSIPATQKQMDALLLAGAYKDPGNAMDYFREVGEEVMKEAELLKKLSKQEGFLPYEGWQMEPITARRLGYEVYLIGSYKRSLDKYVRRNPVTHLEAVNLGLDVCSALTACRQAGALYVDLKPANIFISEKKEYRIGDLGFIELDAMRYMALPDKYRSCYTPPELHDPMATLNLTADTYALGMILYQLYNDGQLPFREKAPEEVLPSPINADYELAEIIMKAIHPDPQQRWSDPKDMRHALVDYMQRNTVNDVPITPHTPLEVDPEDVVFFRKRAEAGEDAETAAPAPEKPAETPEADAAESNGADPATGEAAKEPPQPDVPDTPPEEDETLPGEADADALQPHEMSDELSQIIAKADDLICHEMSGELSRITAKADDPIPHEISNEPSPITAKADDPHGMSDELSQIIAKADDLIAHETPVGVVLPEVPDPPDPFAFAKEDSDEVDDSDVPVDPVMEDETEKPKKKKGGRKFASGEGKRKAKKVFSWLLFLLFLAGIGCGGFWAYRNLYLQTIDGLTVNGDKNQLSVTVDTQVDNALLRVICSDNYGNAQTKELENGSAVFTDLLPNTMYKVQLEIEGLHKLVGQTSDFFTTDTTTNIVTFTAVTGPEDGSVMLNFTVDGDEPEEWAVVYQTNGEEEQRQTFNGHSVSISGLSIGKVYTFTLDAGESLSLSGKDSLDFMASRLILAQNLTVTSSGGSDMTIRWEAPGDIVVESWNVRCYSESGYEEQRTVSDTEVYLTGIDPTVSYTVEVTAAGMTQPARSSITANPINITALNVEDSDYGKLTVRWDYTGSDPVGGWLLMYTIDGSDSKNVVKCGTASAVITPQIPGAKYQFTIHAADTTSIFSNVHTYTCPEAEDFAENGLTAEEITVQLLKTPDNSDWRFENVGSDAFTDQFASGDPISMVLHGTSDFYLPGYDTDILYVIRDAHGNVLPEWVSQTKVYWKDIWFAGDYHYGELDLPAAPTDAGDYSLTLYINGSKVATMDFSITE